MKSLPQHLGVQHAAPSSTGRRGPVLLLLLPMLALASAAKAEYEPSASLSSCVSRVVNLARAEGAKPYGEPVVDFLLAGQQRAFDYRLPRDGCFGFVAMGHRQVQHLGLTLYAPSGRVLARNESRNAHAYTRFCGKAGRRFVVETRMLDGEGEFHLVPLWNGPERLRSLSPTMSNCMEAGAPRPRPVDVGPEPLGPPIEHELLTVSRGLARQGYQAQSGVLFGALGERRHETRRIALDADRCYALAAVGDADVHDIDLRLLSTDGTPRVVAADTTRRRDALVKLCTDRSGVFLLDVRMYRGAGNYLVQSYRLAEPHERELAGVEGDSRIPYGETVTRLKRLGMGTEALTWGLLRPGDAQSVPLQLSGGSCYAVAAIASTDFGAGDLDLSLVDDQGRFAAAEHGPEPHPLVFHCPRESAVYKAVLRGHDVRRPSRFLLLLGKDMPVKQEHLP